MRCLSEAGDGKHSRTVGASPKARWRRKGTALARQGICVVRPVLFCIIVLGGGSADSFGRLFRRSSKLGLVESSPSRIKTFPCSDWLLRRDHMLSQNFQLLVWGESVGRTDAWIVLRVGMDVDHAKDWFWGSAEVFSVLVLLERFEQLFSIEYQR